MRDPGHISLAAWNQERPYTRDADGYDLEQDQRWELVDPSGFYLQELSPTRRDAGVGPGAAARSVDNPLDAPATPSGRRVPSS